jgi:predicted nucleic acid-binding protein
MRIIVSDTSCIIDLGKCRLMRVALRLPYSFVMPDVLFEDELIDFGTVTRGELRRHGLEVVELDGAGTERALEHFAHHRRSLTVRDCFALALAEQTKNCILLAGDGPLRRIAVSMKLEVHGVLWAVDQLEHYQLATIKELVEALVLFDENARVFLPPSEVRQRLRRLRQRL